MHLQVVQIVTFVVAFSMAASRILNGSKPFWGLMPPWLAGVLPSVVVAVPALGQVVVGAQTWTDLTVAFMAAGALLLPGTHSHTVALLPPSGPGSAPRAGLIGAAALLLVFALSASLTACSLFGSGGSFWPVVEHCAPSPASLVSQVEDVLLAGGDYEAALKQLALQDGAGIIQCAVAAAVDLLTAKAGKVGASPESAPAAARGKAFLAAHPVSQ